MTCYGAHRSVSPVVFSGCSGTAPPTRSRRSDRASPPPFPSRVLLTGVRSDHRAPFPPGDRPSPADPFWIFFGSGRVAMRHLGRGISPRDRREMQQITGTGSRPKRRLLKAEREKLTKLESAVYELAAQAGAGDARRITTNLLSDEGHDRLGRRSSSAWAKHYDAFRMSGAAEHLPDPIRDLPWVAPLQEERAAPRLLRPLQHLGTAVRSDQDHLDIRGSGIPLQRLRAGIHQGRGDGNRSARYRAGWREQSRGPPRHRTRCAT
jgi:hypothetical protein